MTVIPLHQHALDGDDPLQHALHYAALGWRVIPIPPGRKYPEGFGRWQDHATADEATIQQWWAQAPTYGVGIACGHLSGLFALDVDPGHGGDDTLATLEAQHGALPETVEAITGGGGRHLLYRWPLLPAGVDLRNSAGRLGAGLDIRAEGGQVVVAPSLHPTSGRRYAWELSSRPGEVALAEAPVWLLELLTETVTPLPDGQVEGGGDGRYAWDAYEAFGDAEAVRLLTNAGWHSPRQDRAGVTYMVRPGKGPGDGPGCSIGKVRAGVVYCFTSEAPPLQAEHGYRLPELYALLEHGGDRVAADTALAERSGLARTHHGSAERRELKAWFDYQHSLAHLDESHDTPEAAVEGWDGPDPIDWPSFWLREHVGEDWLVEPILPRGRQVALWASHKTGKSLVTLEVAAAMATGTSVMSQDAGEPVDVVYLDYEMTEDDLHERLDDMGYGPDQDLSRLHYYLLPSLPPLDSDEGGRVLEAIAKRHQAVAVVVDTMARAAAGEENSADTYRDFYRHTGIRLKAMGVSVLRLDHGGKDATKGQRGSSSKGDDVDVVWQLRKIEGGLQLKRDVSRMSWVPELVTLRRQDGPLRHVTERPGDGGPVRLEGVAAIAEEMMAMGITSTMSQREAMSLFRGGGGQGSSQAAREAHRMLRELEVAAIAGGQDQKERMPWEG